MKSTITIFLFCCQALLSSGQTWTTTGTNIVQNGYILARDGNLSSPRIQQITSPTEFRLGDTLYADPFAKGAYNSFGLSDVNPVATPYTANTQGNTHVKFAFYHGYQTPTSNFLSVIQNGTQSDATDFGNYSRLRIIFGENGMQFEKSIDGVTWVLHKLGAKGSGVYYPFVQLENQNTYSAWYNIRIGRASRKTFVDTTCQIVNVYVSKDGGYALDASGTALYKAMFGIFPPSLTNAPVVEQFTISGSRYTLFKNGAWRREKQVNGTWTDDPF